MVMILKRLRERLIVLAFCAFAIICCCVGTHLVRERETVQTAEETSARSLTGWSRCSVRAGLPTS